MLRRGHYSRTTQGKPWENSYFRCPVSLGWTCSTQLQGERTEGLYLCINDCPESLPLFLEVQWETERRGEIMRVWVGKEVEMIWGSWGRRNNMIRIYSMKKILNMKNHKQNKTYESGLKMSLKMIYLWTCVSGSGPPHNFSVRAWTCVPLFCTGPSPVCSRIHNWGRIFVSMFGDQAIRYIINLNGIDITKGDSKRE